MNEVQEQRPCYICGENVLWRNIGLGWVPIQYHDCKPVPRAKLEQAERERDEARAEVERLKKGLDDEMGKAGEWIDIRTHRERVAAAVARISDRARKMESERAEAVELLRSAWGHIPQWETSVRNSIAGFLAGQPAPVKPVVDDAMVERACYALRHGKGMRAALVAALEGRT